MVRRKTTQEFITQAIMVHKDKYDYLDVEYIANVIKIKINCKIHGVFEQTPHDHLSGRGCKDCGTIQTSNKQRKTTNEFIKGAINVHGYKYAYDKAEYINNKTKIKIICEIHGIFEQIPNEHLYGSGCNDCGIIQSGDKRRKTTEEFVKQAIGVHKNKYDYSRVEYINNKTKVKIICKIHGIFEQTPKDHLSGSGCNNCGNTQKGNKQRKTIEDFVKQAIRIHKNKYDYSQLEYVNNKTNVKIECKIHDIFEQSPNNHLSGKGCNRCNNYTNEDETIGILENLTNKPFVKTKLKVLKNLELDGYNKDLKLAIEYNGEQHYNYNPFFHRNGIVDLIKQKQRDSLKEKLCNENDIFLIVLPYYIKDKEDFILGEYETFLFIKNIFN